MEEIRASRSNRHPTILRVDHESDFRGLDDNLVGIRCVDDDVGFTAHAGYLCGRSTEHGSDELRRVDVAQTIETLLEGAFVEVGLRVEERLDIEDTADDVILPDGFLFEKRPRIVDDREGVLSGAVGRGVGAVGQRERHRVGGAELQVAERERNLDVGRRLAVGETNGRVHRKDLRTLLSGIEEDAGAELSGVRAAHDRHENRVLAFADLDLRRSVYGEIDAVAVDTVCGIGIVVGAGREACQRDDRQ